MISNALTTTHPPPTTGPHRHGATHWMAMTLIKRVDGAATHLSTTCTSIRVVANLPLLLRLCNELDACLPHGRGRVCV